MKIVIDLIELENERNEKFRGSAIGLSGRTNADNGITFAVHMDFAADDMRIGAEMFAPHLVGEDDNVIFSGHGFVGPDVTPEEQRFAKQLLQKTRRGAP